MNLDTAVMRLGTVACAALFVCGCVAGYGGYDGYDGYDGGVGYVGGFYEPYGYDYGGWGGRYRVGPPRGGPWHDGHGGDGRGSDGHGGDGHGGGGHPGGGGRAAPSIPGGHGHGHGH